MFKIFFNESPTSKYQEVPFAHKFQFLTALEKSKTLAVLGPWPSAETMGRK